MVAPRGTEIEIITDGLGHCIIDIVRARPGTNTGKVKPEKPRPPQRTGPAAVDNAPLVPHYHHRCCAPTRKSGHPPCKNHWDRCQFVEHARWRAEHPTLELERVSLEVCVHDSLKLARFCKRCRSK